MNSPATILEKLAFIANTPEMGGTIRADARIIRERLEQEAIRHATELHNISEAFNLDCWRKVESNWTPTEIQSALSAERHRAHYHATQSRAKVEGGK